MGEREKQRVMAIIANVTYGMDDRDRVSLMFTTYLDEATAANHWVQNPQAEEIIKAARVSDVHRLEGMPCWVLTDGLTSTFDGICAIPRGRHS